MLHLRFNFFYPFAQNKKDKDTVLINGTSGLPLFWNDCSSRPVELHMLITNHFHTRESLFSYSSCIFDSSPNLPLSFFYGEASVPRAAPVSHYHHWRSSTWLLSSFPTVPSCLSSLWLLPTYIYLQLHSLRTSFPPFPFMEISWAPFSPATSAITDSAQMGFVNCEVI